MTAAREVMQMIDANARQAGNFRVREDLLTRLDCNQREPRLILRRPRILSPTWFDAAVRLGDADTPCNSRSVSSAAKLIL